MVTLTDTLPWVHLPVSVPLLCNPHRVKNGQNDQTFMNRPAGYGHPTDNLKTDLESALKNLSFEPFWVVLV